MADEIRHAAWQDRTYGVRLRVADGAPEELANGLTDFLDALDVVHEVLDDDAGDAGALRISIVEMRDGEEVETWSYPPSGGTAGSDVVEVFGFDPTTWRAAGREYARPTWTTRLGARPPATRTQHTPQRPAADAPQASGEAPRPVRVRVRIEELWDDIPSRALLLLAACGLWFSVTLVDPTFVTVLLAALAGLWWRQRRRQPLAELDADDYL